MRLGLAADGRRFPVLSAAIVICLISSAGVPPWLGFWEKLAVACGTLIGVVSPSSQAPPVSHGGLVLLTVVLVGHCLLQLRISLAVVTTMFLERTFTQHSRPGRSFAGFVSVTVAFALTVEGLDPTTVISLADPPPPAAAHAQAGIEVTHGLTRSVTAVSRRQSQIGYVPSPPGT